MANHRAPKRSASRSGKPEVVTLDATSPAPGRRKAAKPSRRPRTLARREQTPASRPVVEHAAQGRRRTTAEPAVRSETAAATQELPAALVAGPRPAGGSHSGSRVGTRRSLFPLMPSAPTAVGAAALMIAAAGAVTATDSTQGVADTAALYAASSAFSGTSASLSRAALDSRQAAVSRDSDRAALQDAAAEELQDAVEAQAEERNAALAQLAASAERYAGEIAENAWVLPVTGYELTAGFGESSGLWSSTHTGLDFAAPYGAPVVSVANGTVQSTEYAGSYGNRVVVTLEDGTEVWYCHLTSFTVSPGESVVGGEQVGTVGSTGNSTGSHLHLEVRPGAGDPVDPYAALVAHGLNP